MCQVGPNVLSTAGSVNLTGEPDGVVMASRKVPLGSGFVHESTKTNLWSSKAVWMVGAETNVAPGNVSIGSSPTNVSKMSAKQKTKNFFSSSELGVLIKCRLGVR